MEGCRGGEKRAVGKVEEWVIGGGRGWREVREQSGGRLARGRMEGGFQGDARLYPSFTVHNFQYTNNPVIVKVHLIHKEKIHEYRWRERWKKRVGGGFQKGASQISPSLSFQIFS